MDLSKMKPGDWLIGGGTLVFLVAMFLPWYEASISGGGFSASASVNGWEYALQGWLPLLLLIAVTVIVVVPKLQPSLNMPDTIGPMGKNQAALIACAVAAALVLLRLVIKDGDDGFGVEISRGIGLFLGLLAALAATAGAYLKFSGKETDASTGGSGPATPF